MTNKTGIKLDIERTLNASIDHVFDVLTKAEHIGNWYGPSDEMEIVVHEWNCQVGGKYRVEFTTPTGETHIAYGEFKEITPHERLAYTWSWENQPAMESLVTFRLKADREKTTLTLVHEGFPTEETCEHHKMGWTASLERFVRVVG